MDIGVLVELVEGVEGWVHVSELEDRYVSNARELVSPGDVMDVVVLKQGERGNWKCSRRAFLCSCT